MIPALKISAIAITSALLLWLTWTSFLLASRVHLLEAREHATTTSAVAPQDIPARPDMNQPFNKQLVTSTAYCPCDRCCGEFADGITASGRSVYTNGSKFIAAPANVPFGTWVIVPGYHDTAVPVLDRGGAIKGDRIDVFFPTHQDALNWGVREMTITLFPPER